MSESVLEAMDTGGDLSGAGSGGTATTTESSQTAGASGAGDSAPTARGADSGDAGQSAAGAGADAQSAAAGTGQGEGKPQLVPLAALQESRQQIKDLHAKIAALEALPRLTEAQQKQLDKLNAQAEAAPAAPDFLQDPKGYIDHQAKEAKEALKKLDESDKARGQQEQQQREFQTLISNVGAKEQEFLKTAPDYNDALTHVRTVRTSQLQLMYPNATPQQVQQQIAIEEIQGARNILQQGGDPAAFAYAYAKTIGYVPKAQAAASANGSAAAPTTTTKDAVRTMGASGAADTTGEADEEEVGLGPMRAALAERFGVRKRSK